jgi:dipeptidyl aminopeptidase/acylaminoacyl peptidase
MSERRKITAEDLFRMRFPAEPRLAPDGSAIAFVLTEIDREKNRYVSHLWLVSITPGGQAEPPRQLTFARARDRSPRWSPDSRHLFFVSDRDAEAPQHGQDPLPGYPPVPGTQLWMLPLEGGEPHALTALPEGTVSEPIPSPDGTRVAFLFRAKPASERKVAQEERERTGASRPPRVVRRLGYREEGTGFLGEERRHLWIVPADGGIPTPLTTGDFDVKHPVWSPDGRRIAFAANRGPDADLNGARDELLLLPLEGGPLETVPKPEGPVQALAWVPGTSEAGEALAFVGHDHPEDIWGFTDARLWLASIDGSPARCLTQDLDRPVGLYTLSDTRAVGGPPAPVPIRGGAEIAFLVADRGATHLCSVPREGGPVRWHTSGAVEVSALTADAAGDRVAILLGSAIEPGDLFLVASSQLPVDSSDQDKNAGVPLSLLTTGPPTSWVPGQLATTPWQRLTTLHQEFLASLRLSVPEERRAETPGGGRVHGWLLKPPDFDPGKRYPLVLKIHGGPHTQYGCTFFHEFQLLAARGYLVLYANPRGSKGYGQQWVTDLKGRWGEGDLPDLLALVDDAIATGSADAERLGVSGGSYGGFMTIWVLAHSDRFRTGVTDRCVANVLSHVGTCDFNYDDGAYFPATVAGPLPPDGYLSASPLMLAERIRAPLLILHSEGDLRCPIEQADQLFAVLRRLRRPVEYVRYPPEADHGLTRTGPPDLRLDRLERILAWFDAHLGERLMR